MSDIVIFTSSECIEETQRLRSILNVAGCPFEEKTVTNEQYEALLAEFGIEGALPGILMDNTWIPHDCHTLLEMAREYVANKVLNAFITDTFSTSMSIAGSSKSNSESKTCSFDSPPSFYQYSNNSTLSPPESLSRRGSIDVDAKDVEIKDDTFKSAERMLQNLDESKLYEELPKPVQHSSLKADTLLCSDTEDEYHRSPQSITTRTQSMSTSTTNATSLAATASSSIVDSSYYDYCRQNRWTSVSPKRTFSSDDDDDTFGTKNSCNICDKSHKGITFANGDTFTVNQMIRKLLKVTKHKSTPVRGRIPTYNYAFTGYEAIEVWMGVFPTLKSESEAIDLGYQLMEKGVIQCYNKVENNTIYRTKNFRQLNFVLQPFHKPHVLNEYMLWHYAEHCNDNLNSNGTKSIVGFDWMDVDGVETDDAIDLILRLSTIMDQIYTVDNVASHDDGLHSSPSFAMLEEAVGQLQVVKVPLKKENRIVFFLNLFNLIVRHAMILVGTESRNLNRMWSWPSKLNEVSTFFSTIGYNVGGQYISLAEVQQVLLSGGVLSTPEVVGDVHNLDFLDEYAQPTTNASTKRKVCESSCDFKTISNPKKIKKWWQKIFPCRGCKTNDAVILDTFTAARNSHEATQVGTSSYYDSLGYRRSTSAMYSCITPSTDQFFKSKVFGKDGCLDHRILMATTWGTLSSPTVMTVHPNSFELALQNAAETYCQSTVVIDLKEEVILVPTYLSWFRKDLAGSARNIDHCSAEDVLMNTVQQYLSVDQKKQIQDLLCGNGYLDVLFDSEYNWLRSISTLPNPPILADDSTSCGQGATSESLYTTKTSSSISTNPFKSPSKIKRYLQQEQLRKQESILFQPRPQEVLQCNPRPIAELAGDGIFKFGTSPGSMSRRSLLCSSTDGSFASRTVSSRRNVLRRGRCSSRRQRFSQEQRMSMRRASLGSVSEPIPLPLDPTCMVRQVSAGESQITSLPKRSETMDCYEYDDYYTNQDYDEEHDFSVTDLSEMTYGSEFNDSYAQVYGFQRHPKYRSMETPESATSCKKRYQVQDGYIQSTMQTWRGLE